MKVALAGFTPRDEMAFTLYLKKAKPSWICTVENNLDVLWPHANIEVFDLPSLGMFQHTENHQLQLKKHLFIKPLLLLVPSHDTSWKTALASHANCIILKKPYTADTLTEALREIEKVLHAKIQPVSETLNTTSVIKPGLVDLSSARERTPLKNLPPEHPIDPSTISGPAVSLVSSMSQGITTENTPPTTGHNTVDMPVDPTPQPIQVEAATAPKTMSSSDEALQKVLQEHPAVKINNTEIVIDPCEVNLHELGQWLDKFAPTKYMVLRKVATQLKEAVPFSLVFSPTEYVLFNIQQGWVASNTETFMLNLACSNDKNIILTEIRIVNAETTEKLLALPKTKISKLESFLYHLTFGSIGAKPDWLTKE